jgi:Family of unknown function (DUF5677)
MPSAKLFGRDEREGLYLRDALQKLLALADNSSRGVPTREDDDFGFMVMQFLYKQIQHAESVLLLIPSRDAGLIARTMIDGSYQLTWAAQEPQERAKRWRSFSIIHDWRLIQGRLREGIPVEDSEIGRNEAAIKTFGNLHLVGNPRPGAADPYHKNWRGGITLKKMADLVGRELYDIPYSDFSDWEHWGVSGIGDSIARQGNHVLVEPTSERVAGQSLLAAFQCLFQTLELADKHLSFGINKDLTNLSEDFISKMNSFQSSDQL